MIRLPIFATICAFTAGAIPMPSAFGAEPARHHSEIGRPPDLSGVYRHSGFPTKLMNLDFFMPWVAEEVARRQKSMAAGRPLLTNVTQCKLPGASAMWDDAHHVQIIQTTDEIIVLAETDHQIRHIYMNSRHPANLVRSWFGHSIGKWDGDTLVVDTVGFNDKSQLDATGIPHSEALHLIERIRKLPQMKIEVSMVFDDPIALKQPWNLVQRFELQPEPFFEEYACAENNKDGNGPT